MIRDLRHGLRMLLQAKSWTTVVVLSLALGIGANAALFSAINGLLIKTLPVRDPDTLVRLRWSGKNDMVTEFERLRLHRYRRKRAQHPIDLFLPHVPAVRHRQQDDDRPLRVRAVWACQRGRRRAGRASPRRSFRPGTTIASSASTRCSGGRSCPKTISRQLLRLP